MRLGLLIGLLTVATSAHADPATLTAIGTFLATSIGGVITVGQLLFTVGLAVLGNSLQKRAARNARRRADEEYNSKLTDRTLNQIATDAPHTYIYGQARVGGAIVAIHTSGNKDQFKHVVMVHAAHECQEIGEIWIAGKPLGTLDGNGYPVSSYFNSTKTYYQQTTTSNNGSFTIVPIINNGSIIATNVSVTRMFNEATGQYVTQSDYVTYQDDFNGVELGKWIRHEAVAFTQAGNVLNITNPENAFLMVSWNEADALPTVRVQKHLGEPNQVADAYLMSVVPSKWTSAHRLLGLCYTVITLDINQSEFQGGVPQIEALILGKKIYDPRSYATAWSANAALCLLDYLRSPMCQIPDADIPFADFITAANVCDEAQAVLGKKYMIHGTVTSDQAPKGVLEKMIETMYGSLVTTNWSIVAGKYTTPVMSLNQTDIVGGIAITSGVSAVEKYNGVKGQFVGLDSNWVATDFTPYQNSAYVTADGGEIWIDKDFPFTNSVQGVHNLCRIALEDQRNGYSFKATFSQKASTLRIGNRVTFTAPFLGQTNKVFRVIDKSYSPASMVELSLKEDDPSIWDAADAAVVDATPNTSFANPFFAPKLTSLTVYSGTRALIKSSDGSIISRMLVAWPGNAVIPSDCEVQIEWIMEGSDTWDRTTASSTDTGVFCGPVIDGRYYTVRVRTFRYSVNSYSDWSYIRHLVVGQNDLPSDVVDFNYTIEQFGVRLSWTEVFDPDVVSYVINKGTNMNWETTDYLATTAPADYFTKSLSNGLNYFLIKAKDKLGNLSANAKVLPITIVPGSISAINAAISGQDAIVTWSVSQGSFATDLFEVRYGATWASGVVLDRVYSNRFTQKVNYGGTRKYWVAPIDIAGNVGNASSVDVVIQNPASPTVTVEIIDNNILMKWSDSTTTLPIIVYDIRRGTTYESGTGVGDNGNGRFAAFFEQIAGTFDYWVKAFDSAGNSSVAVKTTAVVSQPPDYVLRLNYDVNFAGLMYDFGVNGESMGWVPTGGTMDVTDGIYTLDSTGADPQIIQNWINNDQYSKVVFGGEYPVVEVQLRRLSGSGWDGKAFWQTAANPSFSTSYFTQAVGTTDGVNPIAIGEVKKFTFNMASPSAGGTNWVNNVITKMRLDLGTSSADDFQIDYIRLLPFTLTNVARDNGKLYAPFTTETWEQHFVNSGWTTPDAQINAGFPYYFEKSSNSGSYDEIVDYGIELTNTTVTATMTYSTVLGSVTITPALAYRRYVTDSWTPITGTTGLPQGTFRYVKIHYDFAAAGGDDLVEITAVNLKLSSKLKNDAGSGTAAAGDVGGTVVNFNIAFMDITSLAVSAQGTTPIYAVYDFVDVPNPTSFKVLLFNSSGTRVSGPFSWSAKGA